MLCQTQWNNQFIVEYQFLNFLLQQLNFQVATDINIAKYMKKRSNSKMIVSSYVNGQNLSTDKLSHLIASLQSIGADIIKFIIDVVYITDLAPIFCMMTHSQVLVIATLITLS